MTTLDDRAGVIGRAHATPDDDQAPEQLAARPDAEIDAELHGLLQSLLEHGGRSNVRRALRDGQVVGVWLRAFPRQ